MSVSELDLHAHCDCSVQSVRSILLDEGLKSVQGVLLEDGTEIKTRLVVSNATPKVTFEHLIPQVLNICMALRQGHLSLTWLFHIVPVLAGCPSQTVC